MAIGPYVMWPLPYSTSIVLPEPKPRPYIEVEPEAWEPHRLMGFIYGEWFKLPERQRLYCPTLWDHILD